MPAGWPKKAVGTFDGAARAGSGLAGEAVGEGVGTGSADGDETGGDGGARPDARRPSARLHHEQQSRGGERASDRLHTST